MSLRVRELNPMVFRATATPIEAPTPILPTAIAAEAASTLAMISPSPSAVISTFPTLVSRLLFATLATAPPEMRLVAKAPAPLTAIPTFPKPAAIDAAKTLAAIFARSIARTDKMLVAPPVSTPSATKTPRARDVISAFVPPDISLRAIAAPIETAVPVFAPTANATLAAPTKASISAS